jgi:hypothetical protein
MHEFGMLRKNRPSVKFVNASNDPEKVFLVVVEANYVTVHPGEMLKQEQLEVPAAIRTLVNSFLVVR